MADALKASTSQPPLQRTEAMPEAATRRDGLVEEQAGRELAGLVAQRFRVSNSGTPVDVMGDRVSPADAVVQTQCNPQQLAYQANYQDSGLTIQDVFTDQEVQALDTLNTAERGTFAHECIQAAHGAWTREYGFQPGAGHGWGYADLVNGNGEIYEIKPFGGEEDALAQATRYRDQGMADAARPHDFVLGHTVLEGAFSWERVIGQDTYVISLRYWKARDGEILYRWNIVNRSAEERAKAKVAVKRKAQYDAKKQDKQVKKDAKELKATGGGIAKFFKPDTGVKAQ